MSSLEGSNHQPDLHPLNLGCSTKHRPTTIKTKVMAMNESEADQEDQEEETDTDLENDNKRDERKRSQKQQQQQQQQQQQRQQHQQQINPSLTQNPGTLQPTRHSIKQSSKQASTTNATSSPQSPRHLRSHPPFQSNRDAAHVHQTNCHGRDRHNAQRLTRSRAPTTVALNTLPTRSRHAADTLPTRSRAPTTVTLNTLPTRSGAPTVTLDTLPTRS